MPECGYLYIAAGKPAYIREAIASARSLRCVDERAHITLVTDEDMASKGLSNDVFDHIVLRPAAPASFDSFKGGLAYKVEHMYEASPYQKTLFADTDTYFYENCRALFDLLEYFDVCMTSATGDVHAPYINGRQLAGYTPYNTGVMVFRKNARNEDLFKKWVEVYRNKLQTKELSQTGENDQTSFMVAWLSCESRIYILSSVWNARITKYIALRGLVKIAHGRHPDYERLRRKLNVTTMGRCWDPKRERCFYPPITSQVALRLQKRFHKISRALSKFSYKSK